MATIAKGRGIVTLINVFTVERDKQQKLVDVLIDATEHTMKSLPGFISASIHLIRLYAGHDLNHVAQIENLLR